MTEEDAMRIIRVREVTDRDFGGCNITPCQVPVSHVIEVGDERFGTHQTRLCPEHLSSLADQLADVRDDLRAERRLARARAGREVARRALEQSLRSAR